MEVVIIKGLNDKFKRKIPPMVQVFYNQDFGFLIVPNAVEKTMGCHISIEPTEKVMPDCSSDDLGNAVIRAIKIAKKTPKVDEKALSNYWKQTKYKGYIAFSRHFQAISIRVIGNELKIKRWVTDNKGYVPASDEEAQIISMKITDYELGLFIKRMFNIED